MQFLGHLIKFYPGASLSEGWRPPPVKILDPPLPYVDQISTQLKLSDYIWVNLFTKAIFPGQIRVRFRGDFDYTFFLIIKPFLHEICGFEDKITDIVVTQALLHQQHMFKSMIQLTVQLHKCSRFQFIFIFITISFLLMYIIRIILYRDNFL